MQESDVALGHDAQQTRPCNPLIVGLRSAQPNLRLRILQFRDTKNLESLQPIAPLSELEPLSFFGDTRFADGDLAVIESLPRLSAVGFTGRRHCSHQSVTRFLDWGNFGRPCQVVKRKQTVPVG